MADPTAAEGALWTAIKVFIGGAGSFLGKHIWDRARKPRRIADRTAAAQAQAAEIAHAADLAQIKETLAILKAGQEQRAIDQAVQGERMVTKEDLAEAIEKLTALTKSMIDAVHNRISEHIRDHATREL